MGANTEAYQFQAETKQLLGIMIHSLYTNKEIFLRELISNASDAIDRLRFEGLTKPELLDDNSEFEIRVETDLKARTLTISDNGIGMNREEVIAHIGTIAKSGTRELRERIAEAQSKEMLAEFIGQFGVGFYSCFMAANKVTLITRRAGERTSIRWESTGDGYYTIAEEDRPDRGTAITLQLKPIDSETGIEDYTDKRILARIIKRYSDFVSYPITYKDKREEVDLDRDGEPGKDGRTTTVIEDKILNSMKPIWTRPHSEVTSAEYAEFYRHISHDWSEPLKTIPLKAEGRLECQALLFIPSKAPYDLYYHAAETGLRLYAKRIMIMERCEELLPRYLRFIKGMVDSADLPLNISRQMLQQDRHITQIRKWLTKRLLDALEEMYEKQSEMYLEFWKQFGPALKEGVSSEHDDKDRIVSLLLFESSNDPEKLTTLKDYIDRMKEGQDEIFYLTGGSRRIVENSPHLEALRENNYEVLYLVEPVDELALQSLSSYQNKKLKSVGKGRVNLRNEDRDELKRRGEESAELLEFLQKKLDADVKQVRLTNRLITSPVCLVVGEHDYSPQLERLLQKGKGGGLRQRRVLELNPDHRMFIRMAERFQANKEDSVLGDYAELLLGYALLAEGSELPDPVTFNRLVVDLMVNAL